MTEGEREELLEALVERLRVDGAPAGTWLVDIAQVQDALSAADDLLGRMKRALIDGLPHI